MTFLNVVCLEPAELNSNTDTFVYNPNQILKNFKQATANIPPTAKILHRF